MLATVHTKASAEAEGQKEDALGDNETAEREAVLLPSMNRIVHVRLRDEVLPIHRAARLSIQVEAIDDCGEEPDQVKGLRNPQAIEREVEELTVDEAGEAAHDQAAENCVDDGINFEHDLPVCFNHKLVAIWVKFFTGWVAAPIVGWIFGRGVLKSGVFRRSSSQLVLQLINEVVVLRAMEEVPIVAGEGGDDEEADAEADGRDQLHLAHLLVNALIVLLIVHVCCWMFHACC